MMRIPRLLALAAAAAFLSTLSPVLLAQQNNTQRQQQQRVQRTPQEQQDIQTLVQLVDAVSAGKQPAPADITVTWDSNHFVKSGDGSTYIPYTIAVDPSQLAMPGAAVYVRVVNSNVGQAPEAAPADGNRNNRNEQQAAPGYPWDTIHFLDVPATGKASRAMALKPGEYEVFIAVKERTTGRPAANAAPPKIGLLRRSLSVPDFGGADISASTVIVASAIEPLATPLTPQQQQDNPYVFGPMRVVPATGPLKKDGELQVLFWVYGVQHKAGKPSAMIEYNFYAKTPEGEKYFNKTAPQELSAETLPPEFDLTMGHQLPGSLGIPLASFPVGEYRLEIKVTDKLSGKSLTQNATFVVEA